MENNTDPDEADAEALSSFIAKHFPTMASSFGGAISFASAITEIGILDEDNFDDDNKAVFGGDSDDNGEDHEGNERGVNVKKKRKVFKRYKKEDSFWWRRYLNTEAKATMEGDPDGRVSTRFRRNFRVPYGLYKTQILGMAKERWWRSWHPDKVDAFGREVGDLELKILGCLFVLATGNSQFQVSEKTDLSEEVHRQFFLVWLANMASTKPEFIHFPLDDDGYRFVVDNYASMGLPGCVGSVDCVHIGWDKCPTQSLNLYKGKEIYPSVSYEVVCTSRKFIQSVSCGHPGSRNDKHIARTDVAITNLLLPQDWLGAKSWEVVNDADGAKKVFHGSYLLCDGGYHRWPCLVYPIKTGLPGSPERKWAAMLESVRKDIEGVFGILKQRFHFLKQFNRMHRQKDIDNAFVTCCIIHNMMLKDNGYLDPELELLPSGLTKVLRKMFANVALDGLWQRGDDDTPDAEMDIVEQRQCPVEKNLLAVKWKTVMEGLLNHYQYAN